MGVVAGLREQNKAKRREAILDAALELLRTDDLASLTTERVAERAEVSPATVYNLVGPREQLLVALMDRVIDQLVTTVAELDPAATDDPLAAARLIVERSVEVFVAESDVYRQVVGAVGDLTASSSYLAHDPAQLQVAAMRDAQRDGIIRADLDPAALGRQIYLTYTGAMLAWAGGALSDDGFSIATRHGLVTVVVAAATDEHRERYLAELADLGAELVAAGWAVR